MEVTDLQCGKDLAFNIYTSIGEAHAGVPSGSVSCRGSSHNTQDSGIVFSPPSSIFIQYWKPLVTPVTRSMPSGGVLVTSFGAFGWPGSGVAGGTGDAMLSAEGSLFSLDGRGVDKV